MAALIACKDLMKLFGDVTVEDALRKLADGEHAKEAKEVVWLADVSSNSLLYTPAGYVYVEKLPDRHLASSCH